MTRSIAALLAFGLLTPALIILVATNESAVAEDDLSSPLPWADADFDTSGPYSRVLHSGNRGIGPDQTHYLTSEADGATIQMGLVRPVMPGGAKVPVIAMATIYYADLEQVALRDACRVPVFSEPDSPGPCNVDVAFFIENFVPHGYAVALIAVRGTAGSGGCMTWGGPLETSDLDQAITWLGTRGWSTGDVAMVGHSYGAYAAWQVAGTGNPHLKTVISTSGVASATTFIVRNGTVPITPLGNAQHHADFGIGARQPQSVDARAQRACPTIGHDYAAWASVASDPYGDPFHWWVPRDHEDDVLANYTGSALLSHGLRESFAGNFGQPIHCMYPFAVALRAKGLLVHEMLGQWGHVPPDSKGGASLPRGLSEPNANDHVRWDWAEKVLRWLDQELKGDDVELGPSSQVLDVSGAWRVEDAWPPGDASAETWDLAELEVASGGTMAPLFPTLGQPQLGPIRGVHLRSAPLTEELRFAGWPHITFDVTPRSTGGQVLVWLGDGSANTDVIGWGVLDLAYRNGGTQPEPIVPGERITVRVELGPLDGVIPQGRTLDLFIEVGVYDVPTQVQAVLPIEVHPLGTLELPVIQRGPDAFYELPWSAEV